MRAKGRLDGGLEEGLMEGFRLASGKGRFSTQTGSTC